MRSINRKNPCLFLLIFVFTALPIFPQETNPASYIGLTLSDLIELLGVPESVHSSRGLNEWQDDVVFVYDFGNFYILRDRVWQIELRSAYRIRAGDSRNTVFLSFGEPIFTANDYAIFSLNGFSWPMSIRFNFDSNGRVLLIFIYRSDL